MKNAVGYLRRSTDKQEQSLEDQKREIIQFAAREGFEITGWFCDDAISGAFSENRSQFQELIQTAQSEKRNFDFIIVYDISRFSRGDNIEVGYYLYLLRKAGVEVIYVKENLKGDDVDEILRPVFQFNANLFLKSLSRDTIRGQVTGAKAGNFLGGPISYGYKKIQNENGKATLALDESEKVKTIERIFKLYVEKWFGYRHIAEILNQEQIPAPRKGAWASSCIRAILTNPVYYGAFVWNRRTLGKFHFVRNGQAEKKSRVMQEKVQENPESERFVKENNHPAIVTKELWRLAQKKRNGRNQDRGQSRGRALTSPYLLSGIINCSKCGHPYVGSTKTSGKGIKTKTYVCGGYWSRGNTVCENFSFASDRIENHIVIGISKRLSQGSPYKDVLDEIKIELSNQFRNPEGEIAHLNQKIREITKKIDNLLDAIDPIHKEHINRKLTQLSEEKKRFEFEIVRLTNSRKNEINIEKASQEVFSGLKEFRQIFTEEVAPNEKKEFVRRYVGAVKIIPQEKRALVGWYQLPKPKFPVMNLAGGRPNFLFGNSIYSVTIILIRYNRNFLEVRSCGRGKRFKKRLKPGCLIIFWWRHPTASHIVMR